MLIIDISCVLVNELPRLQIFTSTKHKNKLYSPKFSNIFLRTQCEFEYTRHISF